MFIIIKCLNKIVYSSLKLIIFTTKRNGHSSSKYDDEHHS